MLSTDDRFAVGCVVSLRSLASNLASGVAIDAVVAHNGLLSRNRDAIADAVASRGTVRFCDVRSLPLRGLLQSKYISSLTYARLLIGELIDEDVARCLYVDSDVVVERDVLPLWRTDLGGRLLAAASNGSEEENRMELARLGVRFKRYFSAGVLLVDLRKWRQLGVGRRALEYCRNYKPILYDQDALNVIANDDWVVLGDEWNRWATRGVAERSAIIHFAMPVKPWHADYRGPERERFFKYLDQSALAGWRPWNPFGLGALVRATRRRVPYLPSVWRLILERLQFGRSKE